MKLLTTIAVAACLAVSGSSADASMAFCFPGPFFGGWGYAYAPAPAPFYAARPVSYGYAPSYYAGYFGSSDCGCSPCGVGGCNTGCATGCSTGCGTSCAGDCGVVSYEKVQGPVKDPGFREGTGEKRREESDPDQNWRDRGAGSDPDYDGPSRRPLREEDTLDNPAGDRPDFLDRRREEFGSGDGSELGTEAEDPFRGSGSELDRLDEPAPRNGERGSFGGDDGTFDSLEFERRNRIPITEPEAEPAVDDSDDVVVPAPEDPEAAILRKGLLSASQVRTTSDGVHRRLAGHASQQQTPSTKRWSGRDTKRTNQTPRWIGVPAVDGRVRI